MQSIPQSPFLFYWHNSMIIGAVIMFLAGIVIYVMHQFKVASIQDLKSKYDYINEREIKNYKLVFLCFGIASMLLINLYGIGKIYHVELWFFIRLFISIAGGTLVGYVAFLVLDYYYPTLLDKKLRRWRYTPRINQKTGNAMRLLSEDEEDVHLEKGMQAEENIFSIDYDVWIDEKNGDIRVDKYAGHLQASKCNSCGFFTMKVIKEEVTQPPTDDTPGELIKHYQCSYCKSIRATAFKISTMEIDDYKAATMNSFKENKNVDLIRIEIHFNTGKKFFDFANLEQAKKFLEEYDAEKVA
jgi:hypothetical protein